MGRGKPEEFFYEKRKRPKKVPISLTVEQEFRERIDAVALDGEKRAMVVRRILVAGLPIIERNARMLEGGMARLSPVKEDDEER